jgi:hypothetical protein
LSGVITTGRPQARAAAGPRGGKTGLGALADQVTLELGQRGEDVEHRLAASGGGVNRLLQAAEPGTPVGERGDSVHQVTQRAAEPVKLSDHQGVAGAELVTDAIQLGAAARRRSSWGWRWIVRACLAVVQRHSDSACQTIRGRE